MSRVAPFLCLVVVTGTPAFAAEPGWITPTLDALDTHLASHSAAEAQDVYKLLHQAVMGPGHAIPDPGAVRSWLEREIASLQPSDHDDPLCEPIGGDPEMVRIHLRPYVEAGRDPVELLDAFVTSANLVKPEPDRLDALLHAAVEHLRNAGSADMAGTLHALRAELLERGFTAVRHSQAFRQTYAPAYRIVTRELADSAGWCDDPPATDGNGTSDAGAGADADGGSQGGS